MGIVKSNNIMSWSVNFIGKTEKVIEALEKTSESMKGDSKIEYDAALPHLVALIRENYGTDYPVKLAASGHGYNAGPEGKSTRQLTVSIELVYGLLV
jgi:hypothetical protein